MPWAGRGPVPCALSPCPVTCALCFYLVFLSSDLGPVPRVFCPVSYALCPVSLFCALSPLSCALSPCPVSRVLCPGPVQRAGPG